MSAEKDANAAQALDAGRLGKGQSEAKAAMATQPNRGYPQPHTAGGSIAQRLRMFPTEAVTGMATSNLAGRFPALSSLVDPAGVGTLSARMFRTGIADHAAGLSALSGQAAAARLPERFGYLGREHLAAFGTVADSTRLGVLSASVFGSGIADHMAKLGVLSGQAVALRLSETSGYLRREQAAALGAIANSGRFGVLSASVLGSGIADHVAELNALAGQAAAVRLPERFGYLRGEQAALGTIADSARFGVLSASVFGSGIADHMAKLGVLSGQAVALRLSETSGYLRREQAAALGAIANSGRFGVLSASVLGSGIADHVAELNALAGQAAAVRLPERFGYLRGEQAALGTIADSARFGVLSASVFGSGIADHMAKLGVLSGQAVALRLSETSGYLGREQAAALGGTIAGSGRFGVLSASVLRTLSSKTSVFDLAGAVSEVFGRHSPEFWQCGLVASSSSFRLVKPCPAEPLITCAKCGCEMMIQEDDVGNAEASDRNVIQVYPKCDCALVILAAELCEASLPRTEKRGVHARPALERPSWFRGVIKGGGRSNSAPAGAGILRLVPEIN